MKRPLLSALVASLLFVGAGCALLGGGGPAVRIDPVTLEYWRIEDDPETMTELIDAYKKIHPNVDIVYKKMTSDEYEKLLLEAFAENRGPDIFSIPNTWLAAWEPRIQPMPKETVIPTQEVNAQKKIVTVKKKSPTMTILQLRNDYVEAVPKDVVRPFVEKEFQPPVDRIFGLPLSVDTIALFFNRDLLRKGNFEKPPATWRDLQEMAGRLTIVDDQGVIKQSGAAIGLGKNVRYHVDLLSAIMAQNGAEMADDYYGWARFAQYTRETEDRIYPPGVEALTFYQSFSIPNTPGYSWDDKQPNSLDAFITGRTAFYFGFPADIKRIRDRAPKLDFGIAPLPQIDPGEPKNIAHYPVEVVSKKTANPNEAWDFLQFISRPDQVTTFLTATKRPTALRGLIQSQLTDPDIAPFAGQVLTAQSWYRGLDYSKVQEAFTFMIETRPTTENPDPIQFVAQAEGMVNQTMPR